MQFSTVFQNIIDTPDRITTVDQHQFLYLSAHHSFQKSLAESADVRMRYLIRMVKALRHLIQVLTFPAERF